jgi:hypothetical protein
MDGGVTGGRSGGMPRDNLASTSVDFCRPVAKHARLSNTISTPSIGSNLIRARL